jgi:cardiolipin synthase
MTTVRLLKNGVQAFPAMFECIDRAQSRIALEMYLIADDATGREFRDRLISSAKRGVHVMVLIDSWGSWELPDTFWDGLRAAGGTVSWFHPIFKGLLAFRNHRKMLLVDDRTAFVGGMNIADEYYRGARGAAPWRDNMLEISGPDVAVLCRSFTRMWHRAHSPLHRLLLRLRRERAMQKLPAGKVRFLESGPHDPMRPVRRVYRMVIQNAVTSIDLAMGYFYPHGRMLRALKRAVKRGVRVRLLFPQKTDVPTARWAARGLYGRMMRAGIEVWEYKPTMMHAKLAVADDTVIAGSANLDIRSGMINYELVAVVNDHGLAHQVRADFEDDLLQSVRIQLEEWKRRPFIQKLKERISYCLLARGDILFSRAGFTRKTRQK